MPGRQQICILCRSINHPTRSLARGGRAASQLRSLEPYDASKLVLDLDAADCTFVRRYEDHSGAITEQDYKKSLSESRVEARVGKRYKYKPYSVADVYRPNPIDFLTYTFWRDESGPSSTSRQIFRHVASHCLKRGVGTYEDRVKWLFAYEALPYKLDHIHTNTYQKERDVQEDIGRMFHNCETVYHVRRITALITRDLDGCKFVAKYAAFILRTLGLEVPRSSIKRRAGLMYINSVIQRLETMGVDPGPQWYGAGMYHAARTFNCAALKKYINVALPKNEKIDNAHIKTALEFLFDFPINQKVLSRIKEGDTVASLKPDILRILTGWDEKGAPQNGETRNSCFAMLLRDDEMIMRLYIRILMRLRADKALRYELSHGLLASVPDVIGRGAKFTAPWKNEMLARVFLHFREPLRALEVLPPSLQILTDSVSSADRSGAADHLLSGRRSLRRKLVVALANEYEMRPVFDVDEKRLSKDLDKLGLYTPETMSRILRMLSASWPLHHDHQMRNLISFEGPNAPVSLKAAEAVNRRLKSIGEVDEDHDGNHRIKEQEDVKRLKQLQVDLQWLSFWKEAEDDLLKTLVNDSCAGEPSERKDIDWEVIADKISDALSGLATEKRAFLNIFIKLRYRKIKWAEVREIKTKDLEALNQYGTVEITGIASSIDILDEDDESPTKGRHNVTLEDKRKVT